MNRVIYIYKSIKNSKMNQGHQQSIEPFQTVDFKIPTQQMLHDLKERNKVSIRYSIDSNQSSSLTIESPPIDHNQNSLQKSSDEEHVHDHLASDDDSHSLQMQLIFQKFLKNRIHQITSNAVRRIENKFIGLRMRRLFKYQGIIYANLYLEVDS